MARKMAKATQKKGHAIARKIGGKGVRNKWAVGMAAAKKASAKRKRSR